jgi:predicted secreted protein
MKNIRSYIIATVVAVLVLILYYFLMNKFVPDISDTPPHTSDTQNDATH